MKKIDGSVVRWLGKEAMIVGESAELINFDKIVSLNSSAAYIWESLPDADFSVETITGLLTKRYYVDEQTARDDAEELVKTWLKAGVIEE